MIDTLTRRDFVKFGGSTLAAAAITGASATFVPAAPAKKRELKKAIMYATIGFKGSVLEQFRAVKAAGFEGVEPMSHMKQDEVVKALEETGLKAASVCCNTHWGKPLSHPDAKVRREAREGVQRALEDAKRYGATSVLVVPGRVIKDKNPVTYDECFKRSVAEIKQLVPVAKETGVKIAIENVWNDFITESKQAIDYLDAVDSPLVGWHFDIGNAVKYSPPETWVPVLGKRILKLHIKEFSKKKDIAQRGFGVHLLEGDNNWPAIMKALDDVGYQGWGISEQPGDQAKDAAALKDLSERMDKVFAS